MVRFYLIAAVVLSVGFHSLGAQEKVLPFKIELDSQMEITEGEKKQKIDAKTTLEYRWTAKGTERSLSYDSTHVVLQFDGKPSMDTKMSREKIINGLGDQKKETPFAECKAEQQLLLKDSYSSPLCKLQRDANGVETKREIIAGEGAKTQIDNGMVANAVLFHAPFVADKMDWETDREISMGNGGFAKGKLAYKKSAENPNLIAVSGQLANKSFKMPVGPLTIAEATYSLQGEQTFDAAVGDYVAGKYVIEIAFDILDAEMKKLATAKGKMTQTLSHTAK